MSRRWRCVVAAGIVALGLPAVAADGDTPPQSVEVIGTSPLGGLGVDRDLLPYSSQTVRRGTVDQAQTEQLTDFLSRRLPGMQVNDIEGSPLQAELSFHGFRASGLLGASQGLSVYLDGVRVNEPFGDVVQWDMIPEFALQSITVVPGANPAFGLNTLGGAIALTTDSGLSAPGLRADIGFGSFGRRRGDVAFGQQQADGWHSYIGATAFDERGWREHSPGDQAMVLARWGRRQGATDWSLALLGGRSTLVGNGLVPAATLVGGQLVADLQASDAAAVYTYPDRTHNTLGQLTLEFSHRLGADQRWQALAYLRSSQRDTVGGDIADPGSDPSSNAALNSTATRQTAWGLAASLARRDGGHQWQAGATLDASQVQYRQLSQTGRFDASRGVVAGTAPAEPEATEQGGTLNLGLYATDTWRVAAATHLTATMRYNHARVRNTLTVVDDTTQVAGAQPTATFIYRSLNPALGLARDLDSGLTLFGNLARNTRVPTAIELGCADPDQPCRLPAGLQSDPYLRQVRSTSAELGARWQPTPGQRLALSVFRTDNHDDILFGSVSTTGQQGYFANFPHTRHQGLDLQWQGRSGALQYSASYSRLEATYQADGTLRMGERNVTISPGTRMAGLPRHSVKLAADWQVAPALSLGADWQLLSSRGVQGNEDGLIADGATAVERLQLGGYGLLGLRLSWRINPALTLEARLQNVLDRQYSSYGALASTLFDAQGNYTGDARSALFVAPGTPRSGFVGLRLSH